MGSRGLEIGGEGDTPLLLLLGAWGIRSLANTKLTLDNGSSAGLTKRIP